MTEYCLVGTASSSALTTWVVPRNKSNAESGCTSPCCCCHFNAWPSSVRSLAGATVETSEANTRHSQHHCCTLIIHQEFHSPFAMAWRRFSLVLPSGYASLTSKYVLETRCSNRRNLSGDRAFTICIGSVCRKSDLAAPNSRISTNSSMIYLRAA
jgi:hypothetical protein